MLLSAREQLAAVVHILEEEVRPVLREMNVDIWILNKNASAFLMKRELAAQCFLAKIRGKYGSYPMIKHIILSVISASHHKPY